MANVLVIRDGRLVVVDDVDGKPHPASVVDPAWCGSIAAVMRSIDREHLARAFSGPKSQHDALVALRRKIGAVYQAQFESAVEEAVDVSAIAIHVYLLLQDGTPLNDVLAMPDGTLLAAAGKLALTNHTYRSGLNGP